MNKETVSYMFLISVINELLDELCGAVIFNKVDLKFSYHQIRMRENARKIVFRTHKGH